MGRRHRIIACLLTAILLVFPPAGGGCGGGESIELTPLQEPSGFSTVFPPVEAQTPSNPPQKLPPSLSSVKGMEGIELTSGERALLAGRGFMISSAPLDSLVSPYMESTAPPFVTLDLLLYAFIRLSRRAAVEAARGTLREDLLALSLALMQRSADLAEAAGKKAAEAARANRAFFGVAARLLDEGCPLPPEVEDVVEREVRLVEVASGEEFSPLFGYRVDYRLFRPEGALAGDPRAADFFRAAVWYGAMVMRARPGEEEALVELGRRETRQAALAVSALHTARVGEGSALDVWERVWQFCRFFLSCTGGPSVYDYTRVMREVLGGRFFLRDLEDESKVDALAGRLLEQRAENDYGWGPWEREERGRLGLRFLGERKPPDRLVRASLTEPAVAGRAMGCGLDLPASLGSQRALSIIMTLYGGEEHPGLDADVEMLRRSLVMRGSLLATGDLSWGLLEVLRQMLTPGAGGLPAFMLTPAWQDRCLYALLGSWVAWRGSGAEDADRGEVPAMRASEARQERPLSTVSDVLPGYVEPNPAALARLSALADMTERGLREKGMLDEELGLRFRELESLLETMRGAAAKELSGIPFSEEEASVFRRLPEMLLSLEIDGAEPLLIGFGEDPAEEAVLQVATGGAVVCHFVLFYQGAYHYARGGGLNYYEIRRPSGAELDPESWRRMLEGGEAPLPPPWTDTFLRLGG